jgi:hypothetical protein
VTRPEPGVLLAPLLPELCEVLCPSSSKVKGGKKLSTMVVSEGGCGIGEDIVGGKAEFIIEDNWFRIVLKEVDGLVPEPDAEVDGVGEGAAGGAGGRRRVGGVKPGGPT